MKKNVEKSERRINKTRKAIRRAYLQLLSERSADRITVKELVDLADINRSTFYLHYYDIDEVFEELIDEMMEDISSFIEKEDLDLKHIDGIIEKMAEKICATDHAGNSVDER